MTDEEIIIKALDSYFNRENPPKFINMSRIPLICQDINGIHVNMKWLTRGMLGLYALVGSGIIALLIILFQKGG